MFIHHEYGNENLTVDMEKNINEISRFITNNEYPNVVVPNKESHNLIFVHKLPCLIFFNGEQNNPTIEVLKMVLEEYVEYLLLVIIDYTDENLDID